MLDRQTASNLADLLIGLLGTYEIIHGEDDAREILQPFWPHIHGRPEAGVQCSSDPCCSKVRTRVEVRQRFRTFQAHEFAKVAGNVKIYQGENNRLPDSESGRDDTRDATKEWRSMRVAPDTV